MYVCIHVLDMGKYNGKLVAHINNYTQNSHVTLTVFFLIIPRLKLL